ncbi:hypothetical protein ES708_10518 [subsurface metagenome]
MKLEEIKAIVIPILKKYVQRILSEIIIVHSGKGIPLGVEENQLYRTLMTQITRIYTGKNRIQLFKRKDMKCYTHI